ncbi:MAG: hypothetical protein WC809_18730 [Sinimarinibacterium sp.]|jgi:hypothetical protein
MRVNVYAEEMTNRVEIISKEIDGHRFTGLRYYLQLPATVDGKQYQGPFMHREGDDDSSAVTFWGKRDLREVLRQSIELLDNHYAKQSPAITPPAIGAMWSEQRGVYAGVILGAPSEGDYYLVVLDGDREKVTWAEATEWAKSVGGELAKRKEQAVMFGNVPSLFEPAWYWSCEPHASSPEYAWIQRFYDGDQYDTRKDNRFRARAVRRVPL